MLKKTIKMFATVILIVTVGIMLASIANAQGRCNLQTVKGSYGVIFNGNISGLGPFAAVGVYTFDGIGGFAGTEQANFGGSPFLDATLTGTYVVNPDCTGTISATVSGFAATIYMVIVDNGQEAYLTQTDPSGATFTGTLKRQ